ncbi:MAG TPA: HAMP domain-containing sensor histidine kinase [Candidatus Binataceae bacterium]|nr:HAMP domain-containing sensor histidine kinase [Candidatus Binataceae bacterium]
MGLLIVAIIIFALVQRRKYRRIYRGYKRDKWSRRWERMQADEVKNQNGQHGQAPNDKWDKWSRQWQDWERWAHDARHQAAEVGHKVASKLEMAEAKLRREADRLRGGAAKPGDSAASQSDNASKAPGSDRPGESAQNRNAKLDSEEQRKAYQRARRRAAHEAGFYLHLMWYGIVIGSLLILNLIVSPSFEWWIFPALGWGIGLASHFGAVYGWRWIHERVFEPAVQREVQREVTREKEALRTEKQASLDELTASFAHEIRNPIAAAKSLVQQMGEDPISNENVEYAKVALDELERVERSVSHLLKYAKETDYSFENVGLAAVLDRALTEMRAKLEANQVSVSRNYIGGPTIRADADKLRQVFTNVIDNATDAMESKTGERRLEFGIVSLYPGTATVVIRDNGCGIAEDKLAKIFNPFYTTKKNGTGLGMGIAKKVMDAHSGQIEVQSKPGTGTEFRLSIPLADAGRDQNPNLAGFNHASASDAERASANPREVPGDERSAAHAPDAGDNGRPANGLRAGAGERR